MQTIQTLLNEDIHNRIMFIGGSLYVLILILVILYHSIAALFKR